MRDERMPGNDEIPALQERVARDRRQGRAAGVPAEVVELVASIRHRHRVHDRAISAPSSEPRPRLPERPGCDPSGDSIRTNA